MDERDPLYLGHMLDTAKEAVERAVERGVDGFVEDEDLRLALAYRIQMIGEAARRVSEATRRAHPDIPWKQIIGMRHKIVHDYLSVDYDIVWQVVGQDLPELIRQLDAVLPEDEG